MSFKRRFRRIYIRHADKEYSNGDASIYKHDPRITEKGVDKARQVSLDIAEKWGIPDMIICSPYRRTRETAIIMKKAVSSMAKRKIPIHIDNDVAEYLGNQKKYELDVTPKTLIYNPPHPESFFQMRERVKNHHNRILEYIRKKKEGIIWIVTHGLIIKQILDYSNLNIFKNIPTLSCVSISDEDERVNVEISISAETSKF